MPSTACRGREIVVGKPRCGVLGRVQRAKKLCRNFRTQTIIPRLIRRGGQRSAMTLPNEQSGLHRNRSYCGPENHRKTTDFFPVFALNHQ